MLPHPGLSDFSQGCHLCMLRAFAKVDSLGLTSWSPTKKKRGPGSMGFTRVAHGRFRANALPWTCGEDAQREREWIHETPGCSGFGPVQNQVQFFGFFSSTELPPYLEDLTKCRRVDLWSNYSQTNQHTPNPWRLGRWFFFFPLLVLCWLKVFFPDFSCHYMFFCLFFWVVQVPFSPFIAHPRCLPRCQRPQNISKNWRRRSGWSVVLGGWGWTLEVWDYGLKNFHL